MKFKTSYYSIKYTKNVNGAVITSVKEKAKTGELDGLIRSLKAGFILTLEFSKWTKH